MFSPDYGFKPRTRTEMQREAYGIWKDLTGFDGSFLEFQGTNIHTLCGIFFDELERCEASFATLLIRQFQYWSTNFLTINGSMGSSYEGWQRRFKGLCTGLDVISYDDPRLSDIDKVTLNPGDIVIFFDNVYKDPDKPTEKEMQNIRNGFLNCKNIAEPTRSLAMGAENKATYHQIKVTYSNGMSRDYNFYNLTTEKYTKIQVEIKVKNITGEMTYKKSDFADEFRKNFNATNRINRNFFAASYLPVSKFVGVSNIEIKTKIKGVDTVEIKGDRKCPLGNKFILDPDQDIEVNMMTTEGTYGRSC